MKKSPEFPESSFAQPIDPKEHCVFVDGNLIFPIEKIYEDIKMDRESLLSLYEELVSEEILSRRTKRKLSRIQKTNISQRISQALSRAEMSVPLANILEETVRNTTYDIRLFMQTGLLSLQQLEAAVRGGLNTNSIQRGDIHIHPVLSTLPSREAMQPIVMDKSVQSCRDAHLVTMHPEAFEEIPNITVHTAQTAQEVEECLRSIIKK